MNTTPRPDYSFSRGVRVAGRAMIELVKTRPLIFIWINLFATWFIGGGALMLYLGSTSIFPIVCVVTPLVALPWALLFASKYGFSRIIGMPRAIPWLIATVIAVTEVVNGSYVDQPNGYYTFLIGFLVLNGIATLWDAFDVYQWFAGDRIEHPNTGFFSEVA
jgi:hypothetical protein